MLLRNINPRQGLCNGTRLKFDKAIDVEHGGPTFLEIVLKCNIFFSISRRRLVGVVGARACLAGVGGAGMGGAGVGGVGVGVAGFGVSAWAVRYHTWFWEIKFSWFSSQVALSIATVTQESLSMS